MFILFTLNIFMLQLSFTYAKDIYGPFDLVVLEWRGIKGPKPRNLTEYWTGVSMDRGEHLLIANITFFASTTVQEINVEAFAVNETVSVINSKKLAFKQTVRKPCQHFVFVGLLKSVLQTDANCFVKKGNYEFRVNLLRFLRKSYGNGFIYGDYLVRIHCYNRQGNLFSGELRERIVKKGTLVPS